MTPDPRERFAARLRMPGLAVHYSGGHPTRGICGEHVPDGYRLTLDPFDVSCGRCIRSPRHKAAFAAGVRRWEIATQIG